MIKTGVTIKDAAREWTNGFSKFPQDMIAKLMELDIDSWSEITRPSGGDRVYVHSLPENCETIERSGEIANFIENCGIYLINLDDGTAIEVGEDDFEVERDDPLPMWGWLWQFGDSADDYWLSHMDGIEQMSRCGFRVYEHDKWGYFFGIDGAGYDFYEDHWIPLYRARGLHWHDPATEKVVSCMQTNQNIVLMAVLECGTDDLSILDDIGYDLGDIVDELFGTGVKPTLNAITNEVFLKGALDMDTCVRYRICELEDMELDDDEERELEVLRKLDPVKDIAWFCNCLDTSVYFVKNEEIYRKYMAEAIEDIEDNMGFSF